MSVADLRATMERERAAAALAGTRLIAPDQCPIIEAVLRAALCTPRGALRPWVFGQRMVGPEWLFCRRRRAATVTGRRVLAQVVRHSYYDDMCVVWTRKAHKAWRSVDATYAELAARILSGVVTDPKWAA